MGSPAHIKWRQIIHLGQVHHRSRSHLAAIKCLQSTQTCCWRVKDLQTGSFSLLHLRPQETVQPLSYKSTSKHHFISSQVSAPCGWIRLIYSIDFLLICHYRCLNGCIWHRSCHWLTPAVSGWGGDAALWLLAGWGRAGTDPQESCSVKVCIGVPLQATGGTTAGLLALGWCCLRSWFYYRYLKLMNYPGFGLYLFLQLCNF